jgi:hypothetical protein
MSRTLRMALLAIVAALSVAAIPAAASASSSGTIIVKYREGASAAERAALADRLDLGKKVDRVRRLGAQVRVSGNAAAVAVRLERSSRVVYAERNKILRTQAVPNDPLFGQLWGLNNTGQTGGTPDADIDAPEGWDAAGLGGFPATAGAKVGIVDTRHSGRARGPLRQGRRLRAVDRPHPGGAGGFDPGRPVRRRQRARHACGRDDRGEGEQRRRGRGRLVQLAAVDLSRAQRTARGGHDGGRR